VRATLSGFRRVPPYTGDLPSPLQVMWYVPQGLSDAFYVSDREIRGWVDDAARYHGVPTELLAAILGNENGSRGSTVRQLLQFGERTATTAADIADRVLFGIVPDRVAGSSSGIGNMSRRALLGAVDYVQRVLGRAVIPDEVANRVFGWRQDTRISGDDLRADLYYSAAHVRELIDRVTRTRNYGGGLTRDQVRDVAAAYNGSGNAARRYGEEAVAKIEAAASGGRPLYFFQPR
jgi:hypothetical protein